MDWTEAEMTGEARPLRVRLATAAALKVFAQGCKKRRVFPKTEPNSLRLGSACSFSPCCHSQVPRYPGRRSTLSPRMTSAC